MPILEIRKINSYTRLGRWHLEESISELLNHPDLPENLVIPETHSHEKRKCEWVASRMLAFLVLQQFTSTRYELQHNENGKPVLVNSPYCISISHTQSQIAVLISEKYEVGIDIEIINPKVLRVCEKFLTHQEKQHVGTDLTKLTIAWSAKETLYKLYGKKKLDFTHHLVLSPFDLANTGIVNGTILAESCHRNYIIYFELYNQTVLTYCLADSPL